MNTTLSAYILEIFHFSYVEKHFMEAVTNHQCPVRDIYHVLLRSSLSKSANVPDDSNINTNESARDRVGEES